MTDSEKRLGSLNIADELRKLIATGKLSAGDRLPSIPDIMKKHGVADGTARRALQALTAEGLAVARPGSGTYVRARPELRRLVRCWDRSRRRGSPFAAEMEAQGKRGSWDYESETVLAPPEIRDRLGLDEPDDDGRPDVLRTKYVYRADGDPVMLSTSWEPLELTRGTAIVMPEEGAHAGRGVVERMLVVGVRIDGTDEVVGARPGSVEECAAFRMPAGSVMLTIRRSYPAGDRVVETADLVVPAELFELVYSWRIDAVEE